MTRGTVAGAAPDLGFVVRWFRRYWLAVWFGVITAIRLTVLIPSGVGFDAHLYLAATRAWLAGLDPWVTLEGTRYAAPPPSLLPLAPLAMLPEAVGVAALLVLSVVGVVATIRLLKLPWWWILFPPLVDGGWNGNPQVLLVPLILVGAGPVAIFLKAYAAIPVVLSLRWRAVVVTAVALLVTAPFLPWGLYFAQFQELSAALNEQSVGGLSATVLPLLLPVAIIALVLCGRERAGWLAVPVAWPATQWYYSTLAIPALTPVGAALMAVPVPGFVVLAAIAVAVERRNTSLKKLVADWRPAGRDVAAMGRDRLDA